jgi:hypothetical protein
MKGIFILVALFLGCNPIGVGSTKYHLSNGGVYYIAKCNYSLYNCESLAKKTCWYSDAGVYMVINSESYSNGVIAVIDNGAHNGITWNIIPGPTLFYSITFICGGKR